MIRRRRLLYVSPVIPDVTGNGLAMRAGTVLRLLSTRFDVSLLVAPLHGDVDASVPDSMAALCRHMTIVRSTVANTSPFLAAANVAWPETGPAAPAAPPARTAFMDATFDVVHLYRLTALPHAMPFLFGAGAPSRRHLDLDETESASRRRLATFHRQAGRMTAARFLALEATICERLEREVLARFDRVYVCSSLERGQLPGDGAHAEVRVLPNALPPATGPDTPLPVANPFTLLFVGALSMLPNEDAVCFMVDEVLPRLRRLAPGPFRVVVVGGGASPAVQRLAAADVDFVGFVSDVGPWYADANAVVVPLRTGGGTRLKVLEAMRHRRPIVSTDQRRRRPRPGAGRPRADRRYPRGVRGGLCAPHPRRRARRPASPRGLPALHRSPHPGGDCGSAQ